MIGCSLILAIVGFIISFGGSLALMPAAFQDHLMFGSMVGGITFFAAIILAAKDRREFARTMRSVRKSITSRAAISDAEFVAHFPSHDEEMLLKVRKAIGEFLAVDALKIHPTDRLATDLKFHDLEPSLHTFLAAKLFATFPDPVHQFRFHAAGLKDIGDLCVELQRMLDTATLHSPDADAPN